MSKLPKFIEALYPLMSWQTIQVWVSNRGSIGLYRDRENSILHAFFADDRTIFHHIQWEPETLEAAAISTIGDFAWFSGCRLYESAATLD